MKNSASNIMPKSVLLVLIKYSVIWYQRYPFIIIFWPPFIVKGKGFLENSKMILAQDGKDGSKTEERGILKSSKQKIKTGKHPSMVKVGLLQAGLKAFKTFPIQF